MATSSRRLRGIAAATVGIMAFTLTPHALADDPGAQKKKVDKEIVATQADLDGVSAQLKTAAANLDKTTKAVGVATKDLSVKETNLTKAQNYSRDMASKLKIARGDEAKARGELAANLKQQASTKVLVGGIARQSYMNGGLGRFDLTLQILMQGKDPSTQLGLADVVLRQQGGVLSTLASQQAGQRATTARLSAATRRVAGLKIAADNAVKSATTARNQADTAKKKLEALKKTQEGQKKKLEDAKKKDIADLARQKKESARLGKILLARAAARRTVSKSTATAPPVSATSSSGIVAAPGPVSSIVSPFGVRTNPVLGVQMFHYGDDFPFACGTPVYAGRAGDVVEASYDSVAGNHILVDFGMVDGVNLAAEYEHLSSFVVRSGPVKKGQLIGYSGTTGRSTGCHLHLAIFVNGQYVNPVPWIS